MTAPSAAPPPAQSQPAGTPAERALDALQAMVNGILIQTGRIFVDPSKRKPPFAETTRKSLETSIPAGITRYHDALNELEGELQMAQLVFRRDLGLIQAARRQREQAEAAERERAAAQSSAVKAEPLQAQTDGLAENVGASDGDVAMLDDFLPKDSNGDDPDPLDDIAMIGQHPSDELTAAKDEPSKSPAGANAAPANSQDNQAAQAEKQAEKQADEETFDKAPETGDIRDYDFDSMFEDLENNTSPNANASDPNAISNDLDFPLPDANDTGAESLLPGLESYPNIGDAADTSMQNQVTDNLDDLLKLPGADSGAADTDNAGDGAGDIGGEQEFQDTNFDDLFDATGIDAGETEPLEFDDWLKSFGS